MNSFIKNEKENRIKGVELYARKINNTGKITSDSYTKVVSDNYSGDGEVSSYSKKGSKKHWYKKWWIEYIIFPLVVLLIGGFILFILGL